MKSRFNFKCLIPLAVCAIVLFAAYTITQSHQSGSNSIRSAVTRYCYSITHNVMNDNLFNLCVPSEYADALLKQNSDNKANFIKTVHNSSDKPFPMLKEKNCEVVGINICNADDTRSVGNYVGYIFDDIDFKVSEAAKVVVDGIDTYELTVYKYHGRWYVMLP